MILGEICNFAGKKRDSLDGASMLKNAAAYAFVEALVVVRFFLFFILASPGSPTIFQTDADGCPIRCSLRNSVFNIPQGETHILRLAGMCSLYRAIFVILNLFVRSHSLLTDWFSYYCSEWSSASAYVSITYLPYT